MGLSQATGISCSPGPLGEGTYYLAVSGADDTISGTYTVWSVKLDDTNAIFSRTLDPPMALAEPDYLHVLVPAIQDADKGRIYLSKWVLTGGEQDLWLYSDLSADTVGFLFDETGLSPTSWGLPGLQPAITVCWGEGPTSS